MISKYLIYSLMATVACTLFACAPENGMNDDGDLTSDDIVVGISVSMASRDYAISTRADDTSDPSEPSNPSNPLPDITDPTDPDEFDIDKLTPYTLEFDETSVIQVSQKPRLDVPFKTPETTYDFSHITGADDDAWDKENSFNFEPYHPDKPLKWNNIGEIGSWNGGFALFGMYFPLDNALRQKQADDGSLIYSVMEDQSTKDNLIRSDILGAYHSASTMFSRIRFRMFHLMTYLRIRLYVPKYNEEKNNGYRNDALLYATLNNVNPDFAIEWDAIRSPDTEGPRVKALPGDGQIKMYLHPLDEGETEYPTTKIKYGDFLSDGYFDQEIDDDYDEVRVYDFSVIIPLQTGIVDEDGKENPFASSDFLSFYFRTNSGATTRYNFNQAQSANTTDSEIALNQGVFQYLHLYVPRVGNKVVYLGASVKNWDNMGTEMLLTPEEESD